MKGINISKNTAAAILFVVVIGIAVAFIIQEADFMLWEKWFNFTTWLFGFWFGSKAIVDIAKSVKYIPELDPNNKGPINENPESDR